MNCTAEKQLSHGVFESFEIRKDSFFTVPQCEDTAPIQIGEILDNTYLITRFIAQGGMGIVYEGIDLVLHRKVAIKVLVTDFDDEEYEKELKLFQTEINLCGNLRHPNVIQIYYSGIHHRLPYLVMEYIEGIPINEYVMKQRRFNWNQKVKLISQVANGLAYIHKNNILHRDIKPSNILVKADGTPVLIDFGISIKKNLATVATSEGELSGTIHYMSPEQVAGEYDKINERSDIYSLGLILYELLIKRPAYIGSPNEIIGQIFNSSLLPPSDVNINISETLSNITMKAIAKEPEDRYSTATEFIEDLRLYLKNGNNKPIINKVPLWQKAFCYLKPNTAIAISLIWIAFFFMAFYFIIIPIIKSPNGTETLKSIVLSLIGGPSSPSGKTQPKDHIPDSPKDDKVKSDDEKIEADSHNSNEDNTNPYGNPIDSQDTYKILAENNTTEQEKEQKTNTSNQITQATQPIENTQATLPDNKPTKTRDKSTVIFYPGLQDTPADTPEQKESRKKQNRDVLLTGIDIKPHQDNYFLPVPTDWESIEYNIKFPGDSPIGAGESNLIQYILLNNKLYKVTVNENELTLTNVDFSPIGVYYYQRLLCLNESIIICLVYTINGIDHLDKIDLNNENNLTSYYFSSNPDFDNINFDNGQFVKIKNAYYFLSYNPARLYLLHLEEPESDTEDRTIDVISSQDLDYSLIENTSIVVLNDTLYYLRYNFGWSGLRAVKVSDSGFEDEFQVQIENIGLIENIAIKNTLLVTDNVNRIWIINTDGVIEYNTRKKVSKKISNEIDSYPVFSSSDSAVSFYSNGYLYCIVGEQAYMLYVGVSTEEKIIDNEFIPKGSTSSNPGQYPDVRDLTEKIDFVFVDDSLQIKLDKDNTNNKIASFVKVSDKKLRENWKREFLPIENDLDTIGIISKNDFRPYYFDLRKKFDGLSVFDSCSVLISKEYYSLEEWINLYKNSKLDILYKGTPISIPCLPFLCIGKLNPNEEVQNPNEKVQDVSKWYEDYKSKLNPREIEQFNYLDEKGYGITKGCRLIYVIPNE